jgi:IS5 family transposase
VLIERLEQVVAQTRGRLSGAMPEGSTRLVSLHDPDARPIKKGRMGKPVEFGYLAQVVDNAEGIVLDHSVHRGNPPDGPLLAPAIGKIKALAGRPPRQVTADRGYGEARIDDELATLGVKTVAIVRKGRPSAARRAVEWTPRFRRLIKWRTGSEGRVSALKRNYGWNRSLMNGLDGTTTWCGYGVFAHNAVKISSLLAHSTNDDTDPNRVTRSRSTRPPPRSQSPPRSAILA